MTNQDPHVAPSRKNTKRNALVIVGVIVVLALFGIYLKFRPTPTDGSSTQGATAINLCGYVNSSLGMRCVAVLADPTQLGPGAVVDFPQNAPLDAKVPLPEFNLQSSCQVPGTDLTGLAPSKPSDLDLPQSSFEIERDLKEGATFNVPQLPSTTLTAGPNWKQLSRIAVSAPKATITSLNQISYIENTCAIKPICIDRILAKKYSVVESSAIVDGFAYTLYDKSGSAVTFEASVKKGLVAEARGRLASTRDETLTANGSRVLAVKFMPEDIIQTNRDQFCKAPVLYAPEGSTTVTYAGGGGAGAIGQLQQTKGLNEVASVAASGSESSECDGGHERVYSHVEASGAVRAPDTHTLEFERRVVVHGGHYDTASIGWPSCGGWSSHDTATSATARLWGQIRITVRNDGLQDVVISYTDIPAGSNLTVTDPVGRSVNASGGATGLGLGGTGVLTYTVPQAGVYLARIENLTQLSTQGASGIQQDIGTGRISIAIGPHNNVAAR